MTTTVVSARAAEPSHEREPLIHFADAGARTWSVVNDGVMGGVSRSTIVATERDTGLFRGTLSLENNGGFASVRTAVQPGSLAGEEGVELRVRGDGRSYELRLWTHGRADFIAHRAVFSTRDGVWTTIRLGFDEFVPTFRGRMVRGAPPLDPESVRQVGFLIADRTPGEFALEIDFVRAARHADGNS